MKRYLLLSLTLLLWTLQLRAQTTPIDTTITLDILKSPVSPAFNMLGISTSAIERPTDFNSFRLSLQNATNNFTTIPNSYAFEVAPFLLGKKKYTLNQFDSGKYTIPQSFVISLGFTHMGPEGSEDIDSLKTTKAAIGIKFSIIRPRWTNTTRQAYQNLVAAQKELLADARMYEQQQAQYQQYRELRRERAALDTLDVLTEAQKARILQLKAAIDSVQAKINDDVNENLSASSAAFGKVQKAATSFKTERKGAFLDFNAGMALDFPDNRFNNSYVYKAGAWFTGGYESGNSGITSMFIARYLYQPDVIFADDNGKLSTDKASTFDAGARFLVNAFNDKFNVSGEALYRSVLGKSQLDASWRLILNAEYDIGKNQKITFAFGRNFDGGITKGGNLVTALNFIAGFGGRKIASDK